MDRNKGLDLLKWIAILTMVIDHLRFVFPQYQYLLLSIGRIAFPLFAFGIAANVYRMDVNSDKVKTYLLKLSLFSFIAEIPYRLLVQHVYTFNIFPTLFLGLWFLLTLKRLMDSGESLHLLVFTFILCFSIFCNSMIMYGAFGVLLPTAFYCALLRTNWLSVGLAMLISILCSTFVYLGHPFSSHLAFIILGCFISPLIAFITFNARLPFHIPPVKSWGYWFYPAHLLVLTAIRFGVSHGS